MLHDEELVRLRRIEGQVHGIQKMIGDRRYCIDILTQLESVVGAVRSVEENILERHLNGCVRDSFLGDDQKDRMQKISEIVDILRKFRK